MAKVRMEHRRTVNGIVANTVTVQKELGKHAAAIHSRAAAVLEASEERTGTSYIEIATEWINEDYDHIDWFVVLNDTRGQGAAHIIEFGRKGARAVAPLRKGAGLT